MNEKLYAARIARYLSIREMCTHLGVDRRTYQRWEHGQTTPQPYHRKLLCELLNAELDEIGYDPLTLLCAQLGEAVAPATTLAAPTDTTPVSNYSLIDASAILMKMAQQRHGWSQEETAKQWEAAMKHLQKSQISRRDMLAALAAMPLATLGLQATGETPLTTKEILPHAQASLINAWQLSRGSDLPMALHITNSYIPALTALAGQPGNGQEEAARLAAQSYMLSGLIEMHLGNMDTRESACKAAVHYAEISGDTNLVTAAHRWLACTYYYLQSPERAMQEYQAAAAHLNEAPPLLRSSILVEMAVIQAQQKQPQDALRSLAQAHEHFGDSTSDQNLSYVGHDIGVLTLWSGLTQYTLGNYRQALDTLGEIDGLAPKRPISERIRLQYCNTQALISLKFGELEQAHTYLQAAATGAIALRSRLRYAETQKTFQIMEFLHGDEKSVQELKPLFTQQPQEI